MVVPKHRVRVTIEVPRDIEELARRQAVRSGSPERFEAYLLDHLRFEFDFELEGGDPAEDFLRCPAG